MMLSCFFLHVCLVQFFFKYRVVHNSYNVGCRPTLGATNTGLPHMLEASNSVNFLLNKISKIKVKQMLRDYKIYVYNWKVLRGDSMTVQ